MRRMYIKVRSVAAGEDNQSPTTPAGLAEDSKTQTEFTATWGASSDNEAVTGYEVSINDGAAIDVGNVLEYTKNDCDPDTTYSFKVRAYDAAGNRSDYSASIDITTEQAGAVTPASTSVMQLSNSAYPDDTSTVLTYVPAGYADNSNMYPLILFLHGLGEIGDGISGLLKNGPLKHIQSAGTLVDQSVIEAKGYDNCIIIHAEEPVGYGFSNDRWSVQLIKEVIEDAIGRLRVDTDRIAFTGLSMGGYGVLDFINEYPSIPSAIVPLSFNIGSTTVALVRANAHFWGGYGGSDSIGGGYGTSIGNDFYNDGVAEGGDLDWKYTVLAGRGHTDSAWSAFYDNEVFDAGDLSSPGLDLLGGSTTDRNWAKWATSKYKISPPIASFDVEEGELGVLLGSSFVITLNEAIRNIDNSELTNANIASKITFKKTDENGDNVAFTATISADKKMIIVTPSSDLVENTVHYLSIHDIEDSRDNAAVEQSVTFTTENTSSYTVEWEMRLNFGNAYIGDNAGYNRLRYEHGAEFSNLKDVNDVDRGVSLDVTDDFNGGGTVTYGGDAVAGVPTSVWGNNWACQSWGDNSGEFTLSGLNPNKYYEITAYGYHSSGDRVSEYTVTGLSGAEMQELMNGDDVDGVVFEDRPKADGTIDFHLTRASGSSSESLVSWIKIKQTNLPKP